MSAFLGPIHFWLYNKIQIQGDMISEIVELDENSGNEKLNLSSILDERYGVLERRPLEEVIDEGNIHGWLQNQVSIAEYKLADGITLLMEKNPQNWDNIKAVFQKKGREASTFTKDDSAGEIYKGLTDSLLDGMPCDHAYSVIEENDNEIIWKRNTCVHKSYWNEVNGNIDNYYKLRDAFIQGFIENTGIEYEKLDEITSRMGDQHD